MADSIINTVRQKMIEQFELDPAIVTPDATLDELGIDSLSAIEFIFLLEDKFGVRIPEEHGEIRTVADLMNEVEKAVAVHTVTRPLSEAA